MAYLFKDKQRIQRITRPRVDKTQAGVRYFTHSGSSNLLYSLFKTK